MKKTASISALLLFLTLLVEVIGTFGIIMALPLIGEEFGLNSVELGAIVSAYFLGFALFTIPGGVAADKVGSKRIISIGLVLWALFTACTGLVTGFAMLIAVRFLLGVIQAPMSPSILKAVGERTTLEYRTTTNAVVLAADPFGSAIAPLIVAPLIAMTGWHKTSLLLALLGLIMAPVIYFFLPRSLPAGPSPKQPAQQSDGQSSPLAMKLTDVLRNGQIWRLTLMLFGISLVMTGFLTWVPTYLTTVKHLELTQTGFAASLPLLVAMLANIAGGWLYDRFFRDKFRLMVIPALLLASLFLVLMIRSGSVVEFVLYESAILLFLSLTSQPIMGLTMRIIPAHVLGTGSGILLSGAKTASIITPVAMGAIITHFSFEAGFGFLMLGLALAVVTSLGIRIKPFESKQVHKLPPGA
ncbi:MFS transporter [Brevibacillus nitrificans]|uniref:MFS transporter n=1 Tax=Brevibacillus nitrificans TaxID=651560 RepID=A0A3M8CWZ6_9BACL|nr:MFS transporter [Brevibacillus nitrificans]RNB80320.1 MFS transporter [Brevibacillus nitrificans]